MVYVLNDMCQEKKTTNFLNDEGGSEVSKLTDDSKSGREYS